MLKECCFLFQKACIISIIIYGVFGLIFFDYQIGMFICNYYNIPRNLALTPVSFGAVYNIMIVLFIIEIYIIAYIFTIKKKI